MTFILEETMGILGNGHFDMLASNTDGMQGSLNGGFVKPSNNSFHHESKVI